VFWAIGKALPVAICCTWLAKSASYATGVVASFFMNSRITFREDYQAMKASHHRAGSLAFARFWLVALLCLAVNTLSYEAFRGPGYLDLEALVAATLVAFLIGFFLNQVWTFRSPA